MKILFFLKSVDAGTGTYLEGLLGIDKLFSGKFETKVAVLERPLFRKVVNPSYCYFSTSRQYQRRYSLSINVFVRLLKEIIWFEKVARKFRPDVVVASDSHAILVSECVRLLSIRSYRTINIIHNNLGEVFRMRLPIYLRFPVRSLLSLALRRSDKVVTVSKKLSKDIRDKFSLKLNPVTIPFVRLGRESISRHSKHKNQIIITVARFDSQKDHQTLLRAFKNIVSEYPSARLWLIGDGPLRQEMKHLAKSLGIQNKTSFYGWVQNPEKLLSKSKVFVLSSFWEGFPLSLLEAMRMGIPVVSTNCNYGPSEIIGDDKYGLLVPVKDPLKMAAAIRYMLSSQDNWFHYAELAQLRSNMYLSTNYLKVFKRILLEF